MSGRCECCNKPLSYRESSARFVTAPNEARRYVNMCSECIPFLGVPVIMPDIPEDKQDNDYDVMDNDDGYYDE